MMAHLYGLLWLLLLLGPLLIFQRWLHWEIQAIFLLITRRPDITVVLFSVLFFPGVLLHEASHWIMARLLGVRTAGFSLLPRPMDGGKLQMGYVKVSRTDWLRDALIGAAPLITGGLIVAYIGLAQLDLHALWDAAVTGGPAAIIAAIPALVEQKDFWLWFYLIVVVSSMMMPSESDRRAWLPLALVVLVLLAISLLAGAGHWMVEHLAWPLDQILRAIAVVFGISVLVHLVLLGPVWLIRRLLSRLLGLEVVL
jgi:hypothetical protein